MNHFGGNWTESKMEIVVSYAKAYLTVNTSKTDPYIPAQCDPLKFHFKNGVIDGLKNGKELIVSAFQT